MKKQMFTIAAGLLLSMFAAAQCNAQQGAIQVNVPFSFEAAGKTMPAGEYSVRPNSLTGESIRSIARTDGKESIMVTTLAVERNGKPVSARLVFHRYGNSYFLAEIWTGQTQGRRLNESSREKELAIMSEPQEVAILAQVPSGKL
jgi:hypothetical protein